MERTRERERERERDRQTERWRERQREGEQASSPTSPRRINAHKRPHGRDERATNRANAPQGPKQPSDNTSERAPRRTEPGRERTARHKQVSPTRGEGTASARKREKLANKRGSKTESKGEHASKLENSRRERERERERERRSGGEEGGEKEQASDPTSQRHNRLARKIPVQKHTSDQTGERAPRTETTERQHEQARPTQDLRPEQERIAKQGGRPEARGERE